MPLPFILPIEVSVCIRYIPHTLPALSFTSPPSEQRAIISTLNAKCHIGGSGDSARLTLKGKGTRCVYVTVRVIALLADGV